MTKKKKLKEAELDDLIMQMIKGVHELNNIIAMSTNTKNDVTAARLINGRLKAMIKDLKKASGDIQPQECTKRSADLD